MIATIDLVRGSVTKQFHNVAKEWISLENRLQLQIDNLLFKLAVLRATLHHGTRLIER